MDKPATVGRAAAEATEETGAMALPASATLALEEARAVEVTAGMAAWEEMAVPADLEAMVGALRYPSPQAVLERPVRILEGLAA